MAHLIRPARPSLPAAAFAVLGALASITAQQAPSPLPAERVRELDALCEETRRTQNLPAIGVSLGRGGRVLYERAFGLADVERGVAAKTTTRFRTASIAKTMTAVAAMQLAARGKLDLDAPFDTMCADWPKKRWPITCRQLLGHLGGVRHYLSGTEATGTRSFDSLTDSLACFKDDPLVHEPGTAFRYTTFGYTLLGIAVEHGSQMSFEHYLRDHVWRPAGMAHTCADHQLLVVPDRACGYARLSQRRLRSLPAHLREEAKVGMWVHAALHDTSMKVPGGGILSTAGDLVRFGLALLDDKLLDAPARTAMWTEQKTRDGRGTRYGLGFQLGRLSGKRVVRHSGGQAGASTLLVIVPETGTVAAAMTNLERAQLGALLAKLVE